MSWLTDLLDTTSELESPKSYFYWSALATISAVAGKKVWVNRGDLYKLYPNVYVFLISKKSGLRKGPPVMMAKKLAHMVGKVRVIDGQNSVQGVLKELQKVRTVGDGYIIKNAEGFLVSGEFAAFLIRDGLGFSFDTLTDLYDAQYHEEGYNKRLSSQEEIELKAPCLTGLFASNETLFFHSIPKHAIDGGFIARTLCVHEEKRRTINSLTRPMKKRINYDGIVEKLKAISQLNGEMIPDQEALDLFDEWYYQFVKNEERSEFDDETGTTERLGDNIWKIAMLISLSRSPELKITREDLDEAIQEVSLTFSGLKRLLFGGAVDQTSIKSLVMKTTMTCLMEGAPEFECDRKKILRKGAGIFGVYDLDECIEHLLQAGVIKIDKRGGEVFYKLKDHAIKKHLEIRGQK